MNIKRGSKGFTLIELLIVVAIIGILAAIAIPNYMNYTKRAKMGEVVHAMGAIKNAIVVYYSESGTTPPNAATADAIKTAYGVDVPTARATFSWADGVLTATSAISGLTGNVTLTPDASYKKWTWGGTVDASYQPKND
jgi:type IV pilus assembly protein PilA